MSEPSPIRTMTSAWVGNAKFVMMVALMWAGLHFIVGWLMPSGMDRPPVLAGAVGGVLAGVALIVVVWIGAAIASVAIGACQRTVLTVIGLALALWAFEGGREGGTMSDWLILCNEEPGLPRGAPYWLLLLDYFYLCIAVGGAYHIAGVLGPSSGGPATPPADSPSKLAKPAGWIVFAATLVTAAVVVFFTVGPVDGETRRLQVYFAVGIGFVAGTSIARRARGQRDLAMVVGGAVGVVVVLWLATQLLGAGSRLPAFALLGGIALAIGTFVMQRPARMDLPAWYWPAPLALGLIGTLVAAIRPDLMLPAACAHQDTIPAWGLVRALPVEYVGVGLVAMMWMLGPSTQEAAEHAPATA